MHVWCWTIRILLILIITSLAKLVFYDVPCEEMPFWVSLLSAAVGYILPSPHIWIKLYSPTIVFSWRFFFFFSLLASQTFHPGFSKAFTSTKNINHCSAKWKKVEYRVCPLPWFRHNNKFRRLSTIFRRFLRRNISWERIREASSCW